MVDVSIGLVTIFAIVLVPVYVFYLLALATSIRRPRAVKVSLIMMGLPAGLTLSAVALVWLLGAVLSIFVP